MTYVYIFIAHLVKTFWGKVIAMLEYQFPEGSLPGSNTTIQNLSNMLGLNSVAWTGPFLKNGILNTYPRVRLD